MFFGKNDFNLDLDSYTVTEVILGSEMLDTHRLEVIKAVKENYPTAKLLQARPKPFTFELEFVPFE